MQPPILRHKDHQAPSVFTVESMLREARRQKGLANGTVPAICLLDPDGDIADYVLATQHAQRHSTWACYHTRLLHFQLDGIEIGVVPHAVGASFAVLVAEELFASGCELLLSITSAGQVVPAGNPPYFVLIERALRDEGTSYHYLPPSDYSHANPDLLRRFQHALRASVPPVIAGATWTTDAPFRETQAAIDAAHAAGILGVEMEAAALYAYAEARQKSIMCFAHITNQMGQIEGDFEKGAHQGSVDALGIVRLAVYAQTTPNVPSDS